MVALGKQLAEFDPYKASSESEIESLRERLRRLQDLLVETRANPIVTLTLTLTLSLTLTLALTLIMALILSLTFTLALALILMKKLLAVREPTLSEPYLNLSPNHNPGTAVGTGA